ncbi:MAG: molybdenum cofactor biosynthesis protein MoaE [Dokdonella sp.]
MSLFRLSAEAIDLETERHAIDHPAAGAFVAFEGCVRDHNDGRRVLALDYQAYARLAEAEGARIVQAAIERYQLRRAAAVHRIGNLVIGDVAVWVGVSASHRGAAFNACRWIIDQIKADVPIWKNEHYADGDSGWLHPDGSVVSGSIE